MKTPSNLSGFVALVRALESNLRAMRSARNVAARKDCLKRIRKIEKRLGTDIVTAVSLAVTRDRELDFELFSGICTKNQTAIHTALAQRVALEKIALCTCGAILLWTDSGKGDTASAAVS